MKVADGSPEEYGPDNSSETRRLMVSVPTTELQASDNATSETVSQLLYGEAVDVLEQHDTWLHVRGSIDGYEGYSLRDHFTDRVSIPTHLIANRGTLLFSEANIKSSVVANLSFGCRVALSSVSEGTGEFLRTFSGQFLWKAHCQPINQPSIETPVDIVRQHFLSAPYLWGGRSSDGLDCSGLVQLVANMVGIELPRDSGDQEIALPEIQERSSVRANDLVFWPGHVAWVVDPDTVIHANAASLNVREESLEAVNNRAGPPSSFRRLGRSFD